jgi:tetratricopeptide (TPR) repeat protein
MLMRGAGMAGLALTAAGRHEEALAAFEAALAQGRELGRNVGTLLNYSSMAFRELLDLEEARRRNEEALDLHPGWAGFAMPTMMARVDLLFTTLLEGDLGAAQAGWPKLWQDVNNSSGWQGWLLAGKLVAARAEIALEAESADAAAEWAQRAVEMAIGVHRTKYEARARATLGTALARLGRPDEGLSELRAAIRLADDLGSPPGRWQARSALGRALADTSHEEMAAAEVVEAGDILRSFASTLAPERAERLLAAESSRELLAGRP